MDYCKLLFCAVHIVHELCTMLCHKLSKNAGLVLGFNILLAELYCGPLKYIILVRSVIGYLV